MKIHVWSPSFHAFGGGIAAFSRELSLALCDTGHTLRLHGKSDTAATWNSIELRGTGSIPPTFRTAAFITSILGSCMRHRPDRIIAAHLHFAPVALAAKRLTGVPFSIIAHGIEVHDKLSPLQCAGLASAHEVLAVSSWTRDRVLALDVIDPDRVVIMPNTFDDARFSPGIRQARLAQLYALNGGERVLLTVARLDAGEAYKGYDRIIRALPAINAACGPVRFILVGGGDDEPRVKRLALDIGVADRVTFAGFVSDEDLAEHYRLADVFAMPSTGEGFGIVYLEAMACGTPVLAGNADGSVDALDGGRLGLLVAPMQVDDIAAGIISLLGAQGPAWWFDRNALHQAVTDRFGRGAFRERLAKTSSARL
ncbi:MAG: glycosyltransferase family 4 protein [Casimicrobiaceae bacterium]